MICLYLLGKAVLPRGDGLALPQFSHIDKAEGLISKIFFDAVIDAQGFVVIRRVYQQIKLLGAQITFHCPAPGFFRDLKYICQDVDLNRAAYRPLQLNR